MKWDIKAIMERMNYCPYSNEGIHKSKWMYSTEPSNVTFKC